MSTANEPRVELINREEEARIRELIHANTWPNGWDGTEPRADKPFENVMPDGSIQCAMLGILEEAS